MYFLPENNINYLSSNLEYYVTYTAEVLYMLGKFLAVVTGISDFANINQWPEYRKWRQFISRINSKGKKMHKNL